MVTPGGETAGLAEHASIPTLTAPFEIDGDLREWRDIPSIILDRREHLPLAGSWPGPKAQAWKDEGEASGEFHLAWTDKGLAIAGDVTDQPPPGGKPAASGVELAITAGKSSLSLTLSPPDKGGKIAITVAGKPAGHVAPGATAAGSSTGAGYRFEALLPWELFPKFRPATGEGLSIRLALKAHGIVLRRNASQDQTSLITRGVSLKLAKLSGGDLSPFCWFEAGCPAPGSDLTLKVTTGSALLRLAKEVELSLKDASGKKLSERRFPVSAFTTYGRRLSSPAVSLPVNAIPEEGCAASAVFLDSSDQAVGAATWRSAALPTNARRLITMASDKACSAKLPELAKDEPFKAAAWFGLLSSIEWTRRCLSLHERFDNSEALTWAVSELRARLTVLEGRDLVGSDALVEVLRLTGEPEAQVIAEFERPRGAPERRKGYVSLNWGSVPLMTAIIEEFESPAMAAEFIKRAKKPWTRIEQTDDGTQFNFSLMINWRLEAEWESFDPLTEVLITHSKLQIGAAPLPKLDRLGIQSVAFFASCPEEARKTLSAWAKRNGKPTIPISKIDANNRSTLTVCAGLPDAAVAAEKPFREAAFSRLCMSSKSGVLRFQRGRLAFTLPCLSEDSGRLFAKLILAGQAIKSEQADQIRLAVLKAIGRQPKPFQAPEGMTLQVGDVHTHTCFSDGTPTPAGLMAEAFYAHLDFCVISDHHYHRNGAAPMSALMAQSHFAYSIIPGIEITADKDWGHMNVYPLANNADSFASNKFSKLEEGASFAKGQNSAMAQWSHPDDWIYTKMDYLSRDPNDVISKGVQAWENYPPRYAQWKKAGKLPPLTGGSDTHFGTFSHPTRTIVLAPSPYGESVAEAIRRRDTALLDPYDGGHYEFYWECPRIPRANSGEDVFVYGDDRMIQLTVDALSEGNQLKENKRKLIKQALAGFDLKAWLAFPEMKN